MSFDYDQIARDADEIIREFGAPAVLTRSTGAYDDGELTTDDVDHPCVAVVLPIPRRYIDGITILASDEQAYLSVLNLIEPIVGDTFTFDGIKYQVIRSQRLAPAGTAVLYTIFLRR